MTYVSSISSIFIGQEGHTYYFRSRALDIAGNLEDWLEGDGDTYVMIDPSAQPPSPWWDAAYSYKRNLLILNNDSYTLAAGYPIHLHFDTGTTPSSTDLYAASQSAIKGDDFRIIYDNTTELSRFVQVFESGRIDIWFDLQTSIAPNPGSDGTSYQLYYGNPSASDPPDDVNNVLPPSNEANTVGLWHFQDGIGSTFIDTSGNGNNGVIYNGGWDLGGKFGTAAIFNGSSTYAEIPASNLFDLSNFTIEGWFKLYNNGTQLLLRRRMATDGDEAYRMEIRDWKLVGNIRGAINVTSQTQLVQGRWYHLAFTYDGQTARVYINGQLEASQTFTDGTPPSMGPVILGRNSANSDYMNGQLQGLRISNVARSSFPYGTFGQILNEPSSAAGIPITPPIGGMADLAFLDLTTYPNPDGGVLVQAILQNQGDRDSQNGFYTDIYVYHLPVGPGDYTGSISFWVQDPLTVGAVVTFTTVINELPNFLNLQPESASEASGMLYGQVDSSGSVSEANNVNNIFADGLYICTASPDQYESDDDPTNASALSLGQSQLHNFGRIGDQDWIRFDAQEGITTTLRTYGLGDFADTYLYLYDTDGVTLLASNDDYNGTLASQIVWQAPTDGTYYALIRHWNPTVGGCGTRYNFTVFEGTGYRTYLPVLRR